MYIVELSSLIDNVEERNMDIGLRRESETVPTSNIQQDHHHKQEQQQQLHEHQQQLQQHQQQLHQHQQQLHQQQQQHPVPLTDMHWNLIADVFGQPAHAEDSVSDMPILLLSFASCAYEYL